MIYFIADFGNFSPLRYKPHKYLKRLIKSLLKVIKPDDILLLGGDHFYPKGINNNNQLDSLLKVLHNIPCPIYGVLGNHDYDGNIRLQMENSRINITYDVNTVQYLHHSIILINTVILLPTFMVAKNHNIHGCGHEDMEQHNLEICNTVNKMQLKAIKELDHVLSGIQVKSRKIVVGHYPIKSNGNYKFSMELMGKLLMPIFYKNNVELYLCGHEHNYQHHMWTADEMKSLIDSYDYNDLPHLREFYNNLIIQRCSSDYQGLHQYICGSSVNIDKHNISAEYDDIVLIEYDDKHRCFLTIDDDCVRLSFNMSAAPTLDKC